MTLRGVNVDAANPAGRPDPKALLALGFNAVRLVMRGPDGGPTEQYAKRCKAAGVFVLGVVANESRGHVNANVDLVQLGNEPDGGPPSSWVMIPDEYVTLWRLYRGTYPNLPMIAAGLSSGNAAWWAGVAHQLEGCRGVAVHPYGKSLPEAKTLLAAYRAVRPELDLFVSEWNRPASEIPGYDWWLRQNTAASFYFCFSDGMVPGYGLVKPELSAFAPFSSLPAPTPTPPPIPVPAYVPTVERIYPGVTAGTFTSPPRGVILHGSRSGVVARSTANEYLSTARYAVQQPGGLGWSATIGDDVVAIHMPYTVWGWNARGCSSLYLAVELAQADEPKSISDGQVRALCWFFQQARKVWPSLPMQFPTHAELDGTAAYGGQFDGKTDCFHKGSQRTEELRARITARLAAIGIS